MQPGKKCLVFPCISCFFSYVAVGLSLNINPVVAITVAVLIVCSQMFPCLLEGEALWTTHFVCTACL